MNRLMIGVVLAAVVAGPASAQQLTDTFAFQAAAYFLIVKSQVRANGTADTNLSEHPSSAQ